MGESPSKRLTDEEVLKISRVILNSLYSYHDHKILYKKPSTEIKLRDEYAGYEYSINLNGTYLYRERRRESLFDSDELWMLFWE